MRLTNTSTRALGAYYTPHTAAEFMARWILRTPNDRLLEPSVGDGAFLQAILEVQAQDPGLDPKVWGVELASDTLRATVSRRLLNPKRAIHNDFLATKPFPVDAVIGNPPYVRLRHLPKEEANRALEVAGAVLGSPMDPSGSVWMPFVLHAVRFLRPGGRLAFVLPFDITYVRYARPLWAYLSRSFGSLRLFRVHQRVFPEILQDVALLFADGYGGSTSDVEFQAFQNVSELVRQRPIRSSNVSIDSIVSGERQFLRSLLPRDLQDMLAERIDGQTVPARDLVTFNIGYVSGDKEFFHPTSEDIRRYDLQDANLVPTLASGRRLRGIGIHTSMVAADRRLFLPTSAKLNRGEKKYIAAGKQRGVANRYKCRVRDPWFVTPGVKVPDVVVPVFAERPVMMINDGGFVASNSLLCGYLRDGTPQELAAKWFTSLTLLQIELEVHALGGGVMILVPREAGSVRVPKHDQTHAHLDVVERRVRAGEIESAFEAGDEPVLRRGMDLSESEVDLIREGIDVLRVWRESIRLQDVDVSSPSSERRSGRAAAR